MYETSQGIFVDPKDYSNTTAKQFVRDCQRAGFDVEHYRGRFYWEGPAVRCDHVSDVMAITKVRCQQDSMGLGAIVYPQTSAKLVEKKDEQETEEVEMKYYIDAYGEKKEFTTTGNLEDFINDCINEDPGFLEEIGSIWYGTEEEEETTFSCEISIELVEN